MKFAIASILLCLLSSAVAELPEDQLKKRQAERKQKIVKKQGGVRKLDDTGGGDGGDNGGDNASGGDNGGDNGSDDGGDCFSGWNMVDVASQGPTLMKDLSIGDYVRIGNNEYSRIYSFAHIDATKQAEYLQIFADDATAPLEISKDHMLFSARNSAIRAQEVKIGDVLAGDKIVRDIQTITRSGVYAPVTDSGNIVVSDMDCSCYVALMDSVPAFVFQAATHIAISPLRMACGLFDFSLCEQETYTNGISNFFFDFVALTSKLQNAPSVVQYGAVVGGSLLTSVFYMAEQVMMFPVTTMLCAILGYTMVQRKTTADLKIKAL